MSKQPDKADTAFVRLAAAAGAAPGESIAVLGVKGGARGFVGASLHRALGRPLLAVAADEDAADRLAADLAFFLGGDGEERRVLRIPADAVLPYDGLSPDRATELDRLAGLHLLSRRPDAIAVVSARALARRVPPPRTARKSAETLVVGQVRDRDDLARALVGLGYQSVPMVEDPGTFAVRGGILDVWPPVYEQPARIELFGDEIESLRLFDAATQRTLRPLDELEVCAAREILFDETSKRLGIEAARAAADRVNRPTAKVRELVEAIQEAIPAFGVEALLPGFFEEGLAPLPDYLRDDALILLDDPVAIERELEELHAELEREHAAAVQRGELALPPEAHFVAADELTRRLGAFTRVELHGLWLGVPGGREPIRFDLEPTEGIRKEIESHLGEEGALTPLVERLKRWRERGWTTMIACGSAGQADKLRRMLSERRLHVKVREGHPPPEPRDLHDLAVHAHLLTGELSSGFLSQQDGFVVISDEEIVGPRTRRKVRAAKRADLPFVAAFRDLDEGDLCVHVDHGLCKYGGLQKLNVRGVEGDFLVLHFAGQDKLFLPVSKLRQVQKFVGAGAEHARLDKLGGISWERTKKKVKDELLKMAAELLDIYARRKAHPGTAFPAPERYFRQFEEDFPFDETPDQAKAIADVLADMGSPEPMDRLICGDVGYGKTEVAMRAAFLAVMGQKQVAVLVPTTILALQHFNSFRKRMKDFPVQLDWVSSLRTAQENKEVLRKAAAGQVDIVIGTHALLGSSVSFRDLGLVVVDEEQKFGVAHKEKLKKLRAAVDVLTLTATPIPRTLHMSMAGVRDMSIIQTAPADRRAIRTFVARFSPTEIREAILREKARGGQVFFVHNRVESIGAMQRFLVELVPEASVGVGHGQMPEHALERVIGEFIDRKYDVLLCTTIIESGLDIPSANTIIVNDSDTFGLAQLYQIRGRVGRSAERAYAYLLVPAQRQITKDAQRRLEVLQQFTELGAGFHIASHDLEIRGAGNLLGAKQSGQIEAVGFDLYAELLEEAVAELRGEPQQTVVEPEVQLPIPAFIPDEYLPDVHQRLLFYKKLSQANTDEEIEEVREELVDRCGQPTREVDALCRVMAIKADLRALRLRALEAGPSRIAITLGPDAALDPAKLTGLVSTGGKEPRYRLTPDLKLLVRTPPDMGAEALLEAARDALRDLARCSA
ncbi:transcription-repair coupling factor [Vulgatibacter incomptus]|nr:transcription-repair coupling factor [Vulgatibacter incomptus]